MKVKRITMIWCPQNPRSHPVGHPMAGHVRSENHGHCDRHGSLSIPRAGTVAFADARRVWRPDFIDTPGPKDTRSNIQLEHVSGQLDAKVNPKPLRVRLTAE